MLYLMFALGLILLFVGGDLLVRGSVALAQKMGVSPLLIGIVLVGFGTSTPELLASFLAAMDGVSGIAVGNVVGSNICNILLVLGVGAVICPVVIDKKSFKRDGGFLIISVLGLGVALAFGQIGFLLGALLVGLLIAYVVLSYRMEKNDKQAIKDAKEEFDNGKAKPAWVSAIIAIGGIALTMLGAKFLVDSAVQMATNFGISESVIGLTVVAVGTSLPELATSIMASIRKHNDVAFGNVVGSNIYNALFILGTVALFIPVEVPADMMMSFFIMAAVTLLLLACGFIGKISKKMGWLFLLLYVGYVAWLVVS